MRYDDYDRIGEHHWYGHVSDVRNISSFGWYMFGLPLTVMILLLLLAAGAWPVLLIIWLLTQDD